METYYLFRIKYNLSTCYFFKEVLKVFYISEYYKPRESIIRSLKKVIIYFKINNNEPRVSSTRGIEEVLFRNKILPHVSMYNVVEKVIIMSQFVLDIEEFILYLKIIILNNIK